MTVKLYGFQQELVDKLGVPSIPSRLVGDEMGLGKTFESLAIDDALRQARATPSWSPKTLIICPLSVFDHWAAHLQRIQPGARVFIINRKDRRGFIKALKMPYWTHYICHWEALRLKDTKPAIRSVSWFHVIADEVHRAGNRKTQQTNALKALQTRYKTGASGSAATKVDGLWSVLNWMYPRQWSCNPYEAPIWMADGTFKPIGEVVKGDRVIGWEKSDSGRMRLCESEVLETSTREGAKLVEVSMLSGRSFRCTPDHNWLNGNPQGRIRADARWIQLDPTVKPRGPKCPRSLVSVVDPLPLLDAEASAAAAWLGGIIDGEGHIRTDRGGNRNGVSIGIAQSVARNPEICARIEEVLKLLDIPYSLGAGVSRYRLLGGRTTHLKVLLWCKIVKKRDQVIQAVMGRVGQGSARDFVASVEFVEGEHKVYALTTETGNYIAWGYASKNSYWRFVNTYLEQETMCQECGGKSIIAGGAPIHVKGCTRTGQTFKKIIGVRKEAMPELWSAMSPYYMRRLKKDVLKDLPDKYYTQIDVDLYPRQRKAYDQMRKHMLAWVGEQEDREVSAPVVIAQLVRLQQFALASPDVTYRKIIRQAEREKALAEGRDPIPEEVMKIVLEEPSAKLDALEDVVDDLGEEPIVVFTQSRSMVDLVATRLRRKGISVGRYRGQLPDAERTQSLVGFQRGNIQVFVGTIAAGGESIELQRSSTMVFLDRHWSPFKNVQAEDREHRVGQENAVQIIDIVARNTVDLGRMQQIAVNLTHLKMLLGDKVDPEQYLEVTNANR